MRSWPKVFDGLTVPMVEAGEVGGVLDETLRRLAKLLEDRSKLQGQMKGAMIYPLAVLSIAILVFLGMTLFIVPKFSEMYEGLGAELPAFTQLIVAFSELLRSPIALLLIAILIGGVMLFRGYYGSPTGRRTVDFLILKLPILVSSA